MDRLLERLQAICESKKKYGNKKAAKAAARGLRQRCRSASYYQCQRCGKFYISHR